MAGSHPMKESLPALVSTDSISKSREPCKGPKRSVHKCTGKNRIVDDGLRDKKRGLTVEQVNFLEMSFKKDVKLEPERKALLAKQLGVRPRQVAIWFQNRRARWKNKQVEQDYETLKAHYEAVVKEKEGIIKDYESTLEGNKRLQAEVARLTNLVQSATSIYSAIRPEQPSCKLGLMSPTKSADCYSEVIMPVDVNEGPISDSPFQEPNSAMMCTVMTEGDYSFFLSSDNNISSSLPLLVQQLIANGHCIEDAYSIYMGCEYFCGGWR